MNMQERMDLAHWAVKQALAAGATEVAADVVNSRDVEIEIRADQIDQLNDATRNYLSLSVYANRRYSAHSTCDLRKESLSKFIAEAVSMTGYLQPDEYRYLPEPEFYKGQKDVDLKTFDPAYDGLTADYREKIARAVEKAAKGHSDKIITCKSGFSDSINDGVKVHSNGFEGKTRSTNFWAGASATVQGEGDARPSDWDWRGFRFRAEMVDPEVLGFGAVDRALAHIGQEKIETGRYDAIIEPRSAGRLIGALYSPMRAASIQQKRSFLDGKKGEQIASEKFSLIDDPFVVKGFGSRTYDGEGLATKRRVMIEKGVLKEYFIDTYYGRKLGWQPNGGGTTNVVFDYGNRSLAEIIAGTKHGILINSFIGGNSSDITGEFSIGIVGQLIENGERVQPVNEMNVAGNLVEFMMQFDEMGNDPYPYSSWRTPTLVFKDVQFSGA
jgi:PmbA protein